VENKSTDIFNISLNNEGIAWIIKFGRIVKSIFFLSIVVSLPVFILNILDLIRNHEYLRIAPPLLRFQNLAQPYFWMLYILLWMIQIFYYWRFNKAIKAAILNIDEQTFNNSFSHLCNNAKMMVWVIAISCLNNWFNLFVYIKYPI
jgi:hypothetical protein